MWSGQGRVDCPRPAYKKTPPTTWAIRHLLVGSSTFLCEGCVVVSSRGIWRVTSIADASAFSRHIPDPWAHDRIVGQYSLPSHEHPIL